MNTNSCATKCLVAIGLLGWFAPAALAQTAGTRPTSLEELVTLALTRNADLQSVRQRTDAAQGLLRQAGLRPRPSLTVDATSGRPFGSHGEHEVSVGYAHTFELGGKRGRRLDVAELGLERTQYEVLHREREIVADVKVQYANAIAAGRNLEIAQQILDLTDQSLRLIGHRVRTGDAPPLDEGLLQVEVARLASARVMFESEAERALLALKTLAGLDPAAVLTLADVAPASPGEPLTVEAAVTLALEHRADLQAARIDEQIAAANVRLARAEGVPDVVGSVRYAQSESRFDQFGLTAAGTLTELRDTDRVLSAGVTIPLPFGNRNQGNIQAAQAQAEAAGLRREFLEQAVRRDVRAALARDQAARRAAEIFARQATGQSERNLELMRAGYRLGETRLLDFITEQRRLIDVQQAYTDILREQAVARAELERALGTATEDLP
ncbi:MAG: TolC family protein [Acidobacteria bacterium]|nr:TolC family protein [Acidobacteriota bacterium]